MTGGGGVAVPVPTEAQEDKAFADWCALVMKRDPAFFHSAINHGGYMHGVERQGRTKKGTMPGLPDHLIAYRGRVVMVEMKRKKGGTVRPYQRECHTKLTLAGVPVFIAKGADAAIDFVTTNVIGEAK